MTTEIRVRQILGLSLGKDAENRVTVHDFFINLIAIVAQLEHDLRILERLR